MAREVSNQSTMPTHEQIEQRAYELYVQSGCEPGRELEHWLKAEAQLTAAFRQELLYDSYLDPWLSRVPQKFELADFPVSF